MDTELSPNYYAQLPELAAACFKKALQYEADGRRCMDSFDTHGAFSYFSLSRSYFAEACDLEHRFAKWALLAE